MALFKFSKVYYHGLICDRFHVLYDTERLIMLHDWHQFLTEVVICEGFRSHSEQLHIIIDILFFLSEVVFWIGTKI
jgi:hypothetical protein